MKSHYRFYCTLVAAKRILNKMINICTNAQGNITVLYFSLKFYLYALNNYASGVGDEAKQIITDYINDAHTYLLRWLHRADIGFGHKLGGKKGNKIKDEVKVCKYTNSLPKLFIIMTQYGTVHVQVYKQKHVTHRALRNLNITLVLGSCDTRNTLLVSDY